MLHRRLKHIDTIWRLSSDLDKLLAKLDDKLEIGLECDKDLNQCCLELKRDGRTIGNLGECVNSKKLSVLVDRLITLYNFLIILESQGVI